MKPSVRISIAYVIGCLITKNTYSNMLAKTENMYLHLSGNFENANIDVQEYESGIKYVGMIQGNQGAFTHGGENAHIRFKLDGNKFSGSDSDSGKSFNGDITGKTVKLYDYDEGKHFHYYLSA